MSEPRRSIITARTAFLFYILLGAIAYRTLTGNFLKLALIIVAGLAAKTLVDYFRRRSES